MSDEEATHIKRALTVALAVLGLLGGAVGISQAAPGPNSKNNHGLCTALFNGSEQGRSNKQKAGPFAALISQSPDGPSDDDDAGGSLSDAWDWCSTTTTIGGQPENPTNDTTEGNGKNGRGKG